MMEFTKLQLDQWKVYEHVRRSSKFNMFTKEARRATGLNEEDYMFIIDHYSELAHVVQHADIKARAN